MCELMKVCLAQCNPHSPWQLPMKTLYFFLISLSFLVMACSSEDDSPDLYNGGAITFRASGATASRAGIDSQRDMDRFNVWGWATDDADTCTMVFDNQTVLFRNNDWVYTPIVYWMPNRAYRFLALASNKPVASGLSAHASVSFTSWPRAATMSFALPDSCGEDLLYATQECATGRLINTSEPPVSFSFRHMLARLKLQIKAARIEGYTIRLRSLTFKPACDSCTFNPVRVATEHEIPPVAPGGQPQYHTTYDVQLQLASTSTSPRPAFTMLNDNSTGHPTPYVSDYLYLIPGGAGTFMVTYELWKNQPSVRIRSFTDELRATQPLLAGHSYQAMIVLPSATSVVSLSATLEPWGDDNDTDREILSI